MDVDGMALLMRTGFKIYEFLEVMYQCCWVYSLSWSNTYNI